MGNLARTVAYVSEKDGASHVNAQLDIMVNIVMYVSIKSILFYRFTRIRLTTLINIVQVAIKISNDDTV